MRTPAILEHIIPGYALALDGTHGIRHWARVHENGRRLAAATGADAEVVALFALFHDARRINEHCDPDHGRRGGDLARTLRGTLVTLDDDRFRLLHAACAQHTDGRVTRNPTLGACWDADRLDLGRVGISPDPALLSSDAARALIPWAEARAEREYDPRAVLRAWGR